MPSESANRAADKATTSAEKTKSAADNGNTSAEKRKSTVDEKNTSGEKTKRTDDEKDTSGEKTKNAADKSPTSTENTNRKADKSRPRMEKTKTTAAEMDTSTGNMKTTADDRDRSADKTRSAAVHGSLSAEKTKSTAVDGKRATDETTRPAADNDTSAADTITTADERITSAEDTTRTADEKNTTADKTTSTAAKSHATAKHSSRAADGQDAAAADPETSAARATTSLHQTSTPSFDSKPFMTRRPRRFPMTTMIKTTSRPTVSLNLPKKVPDLISYTNNVVQKMTNNPAFPGTITALALVQTALAGLQTSETAALNRAKGAATERNEKRTALVGALQQLRAYVQATADAGAANAASIIQSAGLDVRKTPTRHARVFGAKQGPVSGVAMVVAPSAGSRASYEWQYSADGGKTWMALPPTMQAKTSVTGLAAGTSVELKYRTVTKDGPGNWSTGVTFVVQ